MLSLPYCNRDSYKSRVPKKRFKDTLKTSLKDFRIQISTLEATTKKHPVWCSKIKTGARSEEKSALVHIREWKFNFFLVDMYSNVFRCADHEYVERNITKERWVRARERTRKDYYKLIQGLPLWSSIIIYNLKHKSKIQDN